MQRYQRHIFVCLNERPPGHPKGCCLAKGSAECARSPEGGADAPGTVGCRPCEQCGVPRCMRAWRHPRDLPGGIWYGRVVREDVEEIIDRTIVNGEVIQRLLIQDRRYTPPALQFPPSPPRPWSDRHVRLEPIDRFLCPSWATRSSTSRRIASRRRSTSPP